MMKTISRILLIFSFSTLIACGNKLVYKTTMPSSRSIQKSISEGVFIDSLRVEGFVDNTSYNAWIEKYCLWNDTIRVVQTHLSDNSIIINGVQTLSSVKIHTNFIYKYWGRVTTSSTTDRIFITVDSSVVLPDTLRLSFFKYGSTHTVSINLIRL